MRRMVLAVMLGLLVTAGSAVAAPEEQSLIFGRFGKVTVYQSSPHPSQVVLFVSGDGGWNLGVVDMAREMTSLDALVVGIDITHYLKKMEAAGDACSYPAADFEALSQYIQKKMDRPAYTPPLLCGYSSGATLVYALLAQAPPGTFKGALSLGFCPDLPLTRPLCRGQGLASRPGPGGKGYLFEPAPRLEAPWVALQGIEDQVCDPAATEEFVKRTGNAEVVALPKVGHGFSVPRNWMPQLKSAVSRLIEKAGPAAPAASPAAPEEVKDLPLVEVLPRGARGGTMAVMLSGDGGWAGMDREVSKVLADKGVPVAGLSSLQYFWTRRTPDGAAKDLERILRHYLAAWRCDTALLLGYSRGADVMPFLAARLPEDLRARVKLVALIGPAHSVDFELHLSDFLTGGDRETALPILPEAGKLGAMKLVCFHGQDEDDSLCPDLPAGSATVVSMAGGHHFGGNYTDIGERILKEAGLGPAVPGSGP